MRAENAVNSNHVKRRHMFRKTHTLILLPLPKSVLRIKIGTEVLLILGTIAVDREPVVPRSKPSLFELFAVFNMCLVVWTIKINAFYKETEPDVGWNEKLE